MKKLSVCIVQFNQRDTFHELLIFLAVWFSFMKMAVPENMHDIFAIVSIFFGGLLFLYTIYRLNIDKRIIIIWFIMLVIGGINIIKVGNLYISVFASMILSYFPISLSIVYARKLSERLWKYSYIVAALYMIYRVLTSPSGGALLFYNLSRNNLSILLLGWLVIYEVVNMKYNKDIPLWSVVLYLFSCVVAIGRFGIVVGLVLTGLYYIYFFFIKGKYGRYVRTRFIVGILCLAIIIVIFLVGWGDIRELMFSRFVEIGTRGTSDRIGMVTDYLRTLNSIDAIVFGMQRMDIPSIAARAGNPHNSYVYAHMYFGMIGIMFLIISLVRMFFFYGRRRMYVMFILTISFSLRIFTDSVFPGSFGGDVSFWLFLFYMIYNKNNRMSCIKKCTNNF